MRKCSKLKGVVATKTGEVLYLKQKLLSTTALYHTLQHRACLYDPGIPGSRLVNNLLLILQLRLYGDRDVPVEATEIPVKRDKLCPYKRNIPVHRDEVK